MTGKHRNSISIHEDVEEAKRDVSYMGKKLIAKNFSYSIDPGQIQEGVVTQLTQPIHPGAYYFVQQKNNEEKGTKTIYLLKKMSEALNIKTDEIHSYLAAKFNLLSHTNSNDLNNLLCAGEVFVGLNNKILGWNLLSNLYYTLKLNEPETESQIMQESGLPRDLYVDIESAKRFSTDSYGLFFDVIDGHLITLYNLNESEKAEEKNLRAQTEIIDTTKPSSFTAFFQRVQTERNAADLVPPPKRLVRRESSYSSSRNSISAGEHEPLKHETRLFKASSRNPEYVPPTKATSVNTLPPPKSVSTPIPTVLASPPAPTVTTTESSPPPGASNKVAPAPLPNVSQHHATQFQSPTHSTTHHALPQKKGWNCGPFNFGRKK